MEPVLLEEYVTLLCANDFMPQQTAEELLKMGKVVKLKRRAAFLKIGEQKPVVGIVLRGLMKVFYMKNDKPVNIFLLPEQALATNFDMLFNQVHSKQQIDCIEETELLILDYEAVIQRQKEDHGFCFDISQIVLRQLLDSLYRIETFLLLDAKERLEHFLDAHPKLAKRVPLNVLASFIGVSEVHVSRIRGKKRKKT